MRNGIMLPVFAGSRGAFDAFEALERAFDDVMRPASGAGAFGFAPPAAAGAAPPVDVRSDDEKIVMQFDLPGYRGEDVEVTLDKGVLTVKGERKLAATKGKNERVWVGRSYGRFVRSFTLPKGVDEQGLQADLADGVLTVTLPKGVEAKPRRIEVRGGQPEVKPIEAPSAAPAVGTGEGA
ncbi:MAG TPA: Hsp20/alpha crystallin family protein [Polyangiaceae bacterium]|nr:Hsp20/alpha crystallin family protein [Polyangiaceae bacterium]